MKIELDVLKIFNILKSIERTIRLAIDKFKEHRAVKEALIRIDVAYSKKDKDDSVEEFLKIFDSKNLHSLKELLPWEREVIGALSDLYMAGFIDEATSIEHLR